MEPENNPSDAKKGVSGVDSLQDENAKLKLLEYARRDRSVTVPVLRSQFQRTFNRVISTATIRRRVLASGLRCRRPLRVPLLTASHRTARLQWARAHQDWLLPQWRNVLFSDESRFGLVSDDYRERVWRERGGQNRLATAIGSAGRQLKLRNTSSWIVLHCAEEEARIWNLSRRREDR
nr:unnamed protein product [Callosobruchus chinensis]